MDGRGPQQQAREAIEQYLAAHGAQGAPSDGDRFATLLPLEDGGEQLQLVITASTRVAGIVARVRAARRIDADDLPRALLACNRWNRQRPAPHAVVAIKQRGDDAVTGVCLLEDWLPFAPELSPQQVAFFLDAVVDGARQFWRTAAWQQLTEPVPVAPAPAG